jgi:hypothetical protein
MEIGDTEREWNLMLVCWHLVRVGVGGSLSLTRTRLVSMSLTSVSKCSVGQSV